MAPDPILAPLDSIGTRIQALREAKGWSKRTLAERIAFNHSNVSRWESGRALPSLEALLLLAHALDVSPGALLGAEEDPAERAEVARVAAIREVLDTVRSMLRGAP